MFHVANHISNGLVWYANIYRDFDCSVTVIFEANVMRW